MAVSQHVVRLTTPVSDPPKKKSAHPSQHGEGEAVDLEFPDMGLVRVGPVPLEDPGRGEGRGAHAGPDEEDEVLGPASVEGLGDPLQDLLHVLAVDFRPFLFAFTEDEQ